MKEFAKSIEKKFELDLSEEQMTQFDSLFLEFMREYHFPISQPVNDVRLKYKYFRRAVQVLTPKQLELYRNKKIEDKAKNKVRLIEQQERQISDLKMAYKDVNLRSEQIELIYKSQNTFKKQYLELEEQQARILKALEYTINNDQRHQLNRLFLYQLKMRRKRKVESTKSTYYYLELNDDQARDISILDEKERIQRKDNGYKGYDPYHIKQEFKEILTANQFESYSDHQDHQRQQSIQSQIEDEPKKTNDISDLKTWIKFHAENILPAKCKIVREVLQTASKKDILFIEELKNDYHKMVEKKIIFKKENHSKNYGIQLPNHLKLRLVEMSLLDISPAANLLQDLNLEFNIFESIQLTKTQKSELEELKLKQREFNIQRIEEKLKGSYASLLTSLGRKREIPEFQGLYSLLLLEVDPQKNVEKMERRQIKHGVNL
ncbi:MAG: hypothetical protein P1U56_23635 [Saprospiraceae bacterium]|nr:hypothetical protein [Saprospiraceae bacterium]